MGTVATNPQMSGNAKPTTVLIADTSSQKSFRWFMRPV